MNKMTVLVVDDEPLARRRLTRLLAKTEWIERIVEAGDVEQACQNVLEHRPDILLLDIQMPGGSGFEVLERLKQPPPAVVFVTAFDHHAIRAFEANAVDYVTKPIEPGRFMQAMARARNLVKASQQEDRIAELQETVASLKKVVGESERSARDFWVKSQGEFLRLSPDNILWFQAERDYVRIHVKGANYLYQENLASIERKLNPAEFMRIHRSAVVRIAAIGRFKAAPFAALVAILSDGTELRVGRTYTSPVRARLIG